MGVDGHDQPGEPCQVRTGVATYKVEPYVVAADVYALSPAYRPRRLDMVHGIGRLDVPACRGIMLGLRLEVDKLRFEPCLPAGWDTFNVHYRYRETVYHITILQISSGAGTSIILDGSPLGGTVIPLIDDRREHSVEVRIAILTDS